MDEEEEEEEVEEGNEGAMRGHGKYNIAQIGYFFFWLQLSDYSSSGNEGNIIRCHWFNFSGHQPDVIDAGLEPQQSSRTQGQPDIEAMEDEG